LGVQGLGFRVQGLGFRVPVSECRGQDSRSRVWIEGLGLRFKGLGSRVQGFWFRVYG